MKKILILFLSLSVSLAFSQYKESDYHFYSNRTMLDRNFSNKRINISTLKSDFRPYRGIEMTYDESNTLFCLNNGYRSYGPHRDLSQIATLRWEENTCYDKKGLMVLKFQTGLTNSGYVEEMYYRNKDNRIIKSGLIGDFLFQSTTEEILTILESVNINPVAIYKKSFYSEMNSKLEKIIAPGGQFWQFSMLSNNIVVLINDKTRKVIAKTYDTYPTITSNQLIEMYDYWRITSLYPVSIKTKHTKDEIWNIAQQIHSNNETKSSGGSSRVQLLTKKIWKVDTGTNAKRIYLFINDSTGEILVDSEDFPKNYLGEEAFKKAVNLILKEESIKSE